MNLSPYRKAIAAAICGAVMVAAQHYDLPLLQIAAAAAAPLSVFFARNEPLE